MLENNEGLKFLNVLLVQSLRSNVSRAGGSKYSKIRIYRFVAKLTSLTSKITDGFVLIRDSGYSKVIPTCVLLFQLCSTVQLQLNMLV